ncbi:MAG: YidC/Oxa1 family membrane protein insertase [Alicyclobacillus sp.]|nr:YidC/Oxa1 family membrane protein insertase [Alicyclobacillus sp.]
MRSDRPAITAGAALLLLCSLAGPEFVNAAVHSARSAALVPTTPDLLVGAVLAISGLAVACAAILVVSTALLRRRFVESESELLTELGRAGALIEESVQKLRERYKHDPQKLQEETMKLWREHGVNPMAGCFPLIIQLPILYALFGAIEGNPGLNSSTFLHIFHLSQPDKYYILPLLAAVTTYLSSRVMMTGNDPQQRMMLYIMPVFIFFLGSRFASGLALYWIYSNLFTAIQAYFVHVRPAKAASR